MWRARPYFDEVTAPDRAVAARLPDARAVLVLVSEDAPRPGDRLLIGGLRAHVLETVRIRNLTGPAPVPPHYAVATDAEPEALRPLRLTTIALERGPAPSKRQEGQR